MHNSIVIYRGPSLIDGSPIICVLSGLVRKSKNPKTSDELQTYIIREDIHPAMAAATGKDSAICGDCIHRPSNGGTCYVTDLWKAPGSIWRAFHRGSYTVATDHELKAIKDSGVPIRAGSYGDPAAIPLHVWQTLGVATGYSHQWRNAAGLKAFLMASVDNEQEASEAKKEGWRYFRVRPVGSPLLAGEINCPSNKGVTCNNCLLCGGLQRNAKNISIEAHGSKAKRFTGRRLEVLA